MIPVKCSKQDLDYLFNCNRLSAEVWNLCVKFDKEYQKINNKSLNQSQLQKLTKGCVSLNSKNIQHVVHKYLFARDAMWKSRKAGHENSYRVELPYKHKKYFTTGWDYQAMKVDYDKGIIKLSKANMIINGKRIIKPVKCYTKLIPQNIVEIELIWRGRLMLVVKYKEQAEYLQVQSNNSASVDLGEIHTITSIDNNGNAIIITGRLMRSIKRFRNKEQSKIRSKMSKCTKGSIRYKNYHKTLNKIKYKTDRKINDCLHKITKHYVDYCIMNDIKTVYYGDLDSLTRDSKKNNIGHTFTRQKINQWDYGKLIDILEVKLNRYGIEMIKVKEYYTSQKCPNCSKLNKPNSRNYVCTCGYTQHRDIVGAINILNDNDDRNIRFYKEFKYLQID